MAKVAIHVHVHLDSLSSETLERALRGLEERMAKKISTRLRELKDQLTEEIALARSKTEKLTEKIDDLQAKIDSGEGTPEDQALLDELQTLVASVDPDDPTTAPPDDEGEVEEGDEDEGSGEDEPADE